MLKRKIFNELIEWKNQNKKKCLMIKGARQVGKTYVVEYFGNSEYEEMVSINFKETPEAKEIFEGDLNVDKIIASLRFRFPDKKIGEGKTLIFFDEIQECPEAITSLKFWTINGRYDVIVSGSLLGIDYERPSSFPVGYIDYLDMYGLDFEEFLWSQNIAENHIEEIKKYFLNIEVVPTAINAQMMKYFRTFMAVGGMPEAVQIYVDTNDFREVDKTQKAILQGYYYDIAHYATASEKIKAEKCFASLSNQLLNKENHKFQYKEVEKGSNGQKYFSSIEWLKRADIVKLSNNVSDLKYDLEDWKIEDNFRAYTSDLSLLIAMRDLYFKQKIIENSLEGNSKGGIYECAIADMLIKKSYQLYFYKNENKKREIEFIIQKEGELIPIEVKAGRSTALSLKSLMKNNEDINKAFKFIDGNVGEDESRIITMPLYMAMFI